MAWTERTKSGASFSNRAISIGFATVGELGLDNPIFDGLTFDDPVPGTSKTLGELTFDDLIRISIWTDTTRAAATFANKPKSA
jgi:hypothetical protein